jgi:membrane protein DedA with SNARE-associated domain
MTPTFLDQIVPWLIQYKYFLIFPIAIVEGPILAIICGFLFSTGILNIFITYGLLVLANFVGDTFFYGLGRFGRIKIIDRWGHYIGLNKERILEMEKRFGNHAGKTIITGKITNFAAGFILVAAGAVKVPYMKFISYSLAADLPNIAFLLIIGFFFGHAYNLLDQYIGSASLILLATTIIGIALYLLIKKYKKS